MAKLTKKADRPTRIGQSLEIAKAKGLLEGVRTKTLRARMPERLVERARKVSGARSDTELIELALANLAMRDEFTSWLISQRGTISKDLDLEY